MVPGFGSAFVKALMDYSDMTYMFPNLLQKKHNSEILEKKYVSLEIQDDDSSPPPAYEKIQYGNMKNLDILVQYCIFFLMFASLIMGFAQPFIVSVILLYARLSILDIISFWTLDSNLQSFLSLIRACFFILSIKLVVEFYIFLLENLETS